MSEPRKINTSGSHSTGRSIHTDAAQRRQPDPRMEEARARARADAEAARLRRSQQFQRVTPQAVESARTACPAHPAASAPSVPPAQPAPQPPRRPAQTGAQVRRLDLNQTQGAKPAYDINNDPAYLERQRRKAAQAAAMAQAARAHRAEAQQAGAPRQIHRADAAVDQDVAYLLRILSRHRNYSKMYVAFFKKSPQTPIRQHWAWPSAVAQVDFYIESGYNFDAIILKPFIGHQGLSKVSRANKDSALKAVISEIHLKVLYKHVSTVPDAGLTAAAYCGKVFSHLNFA